MPSSTTDSSTLQPGMRSELLLASVNSTADVGFAAGREIAMAVRGLLGASDNV